MKYSFAIGLLICIFVTGFPAFLSALNTPEGEVWVPVQSSKVECGDDKYYYAAVREVKSHFLRHRSPIRETVGSYIYEVTKGSATRLTAVAQLPFWGDRVSILGGQVILLSLAYTALFLLFRCFGLASSTVLGISAFVLYWNRIFLNPTNPAAALKSVSSGEWLTGQMNNFFRPVVLESALVIQLIFLLLLIRALKGSGKYLWDLVSLSLVAVLYAYPSLGSVSALVLVLVMAINLRLHHFSIPIIRIMAVVCMLLVLIGGFSHFVQILQGHHSTVDQSLTTSGQGAHYIHWYGLFLLVLPVIVLLPSPWLTIEIRVVTVSFYLALAILYSIGFISSLDHAVYKMLTRGWRELWLVFTCGILLVMIQHRLPLLAKVLRVGMFALVIIPIFGAISLARAQMKSGTYFMNKDLWDTYEFLRGKGDTKPTTALALDVGDQNLIPVYTDLDLITAGANFGTASVESEIERFITGWLCLGQSKTDLKNMFLSYAEIRPQLTCKRDVMFSKRTIMEKGWEVKHLVYEPYIKYLYGFLIWNQNTRNWSSEFISRIDQLIDAVPDCTWLWSASDLIVVSSKLESEFLKATHYREVFRNSARVIYERDQ